MEIKLKKLVFDSNIDLAPIDIALKSNKILSFIPNDINILQLLKSKILDGEIQYQKATINKQNYDSKIRVLKEKLYLCDVLDGLYNINVLEDIKVRVPNYNKENLEQLLKDFNMNHNILNKNHLELSDSEKVKILLICSLMSNKKIIIYNNPTLYLDSKSIDCLVKKIKYIKKDKCILIISNNIEFLFQISDDVMVKVDNKIILGNKYEVLGNKKLMKEINCDLPSILLMINVVSDLKSVKLKNRDNINDLIKDIYRNVK